MALHSSTFTKNRLFLGAEIGGGGDSHSHHRDNSIRILTTPAVSAFLQRTWQLS